MAGSFSSGRDVGIVDVKTDARNWRHVCVRDDAGTFRMRQEAAKSAFNSKADSANTLARHGLENLRAPT
jgi:hypothetical protein